MSDEQDTREARALERWGLQPSFVDASERLGAPRSRMGRVVTEHRGFYGLVTDEAELLGETSGSLRRAIKRGEAERPAVGDWVILEARPTEGSATIETVLPRRSKLSRKAAGRDSEQVLAANVDIAFLVSALDSDFSPRCIERYLAVALGGGVRPVVVLTKADVCDDIDAARGEAERVAAGASVHAVSSLSGVGLAELDVYFEGNPTVVVLGSSGVGKSTLINRWIGEARQITRAIRDDGKGRHTTTHREMFARPGGGLVIDTPGMRELGLWDVGEGIDDVFSEVEQIAADCRFRDCTHQSEPGCAVRAALAEGRLGADRVESFSKLRGELEHLATQREASARAKGKREQKVMTRALNAWLKRKGR